MHAPHKEEDALPGDLHDDEIGAQGGAREESGVEGASGGADWDSLGGVGEEGLGNTPLSQPHHPNHPLPHPEHLVHAAEATARQIPSNGQGLMGWGRGGSTCVVLGWWWRCQGSGSTS